MRAVPPVLMILLLVACGDGGESDRYPATATVRIESPRETFTIPVEIAATSRARQRGLMGRSFLVPDEGMLFIYPDVAPRSFWMRDCLVSIDAAFLSTDGRILNVEEMEPEPGGLGLRSYPSAAPVRLVLEMPGGWFRDHGVTVGDRVVLPDGLLRDSP